MSITSIKNHSDGIATALATERRRQRENEWHEKSLEPGAEPGAKAEIVTEQLNGVEFECECGGTYDELGRCNGCENGHSDCDPQECFDCLERAIGRAEDAAEGER